MGFNDGSDVELAWTNTINRAVLIHVRWKGMLALGDGKKERREHPTQKPIELAEILIRKFSKPDDLILDPYVGVGWALIAAKRCGRRALGFEIHEPYCEIAVRRLHDTPRPMVAL